MMTMEEKEQNPIIPMNILPITNFRHGVHTRSQLLLTPRSEAGCQDTITGSSGLMDRYLVRRMAQIIKPMHTSHHQTGIQFP